MNSTLTVSETAHALGCHPETVRRLARRGVLKCYRDYRNHRLFHKNDILHLKQKRDEITPEGECFEESAMDFESNAPLEALEG